MIETRDRMIDPSFHAVYRRALERHVATPGEATLHEAYELGRAAFDMEMVVLDLAHVHHDALSALLATAPAGDLEDVLAGAADFLAEALTASEMVHRAYVEIRDEELRQREHAALVRRLSALLADASLAAHGREAIGEMVQIVAEHAREITGAAACVVHVESRFRPLKGVSVDDEVQRQLGEPDLTIALTSLEGVGLGKMNLWSTTPSGFPKPSEALAHHLAQMTSAALDRVQLRAGARPR